MLLERASHFRISPYLQELMVFAGHLDVYARGAEIIEKMLRVSSNPAQIHRVSNHHAAQLAEVLYEPSAARSVDRDEVVYAEIDGSMIFTDNQWREVKLGRVFASGDVEAASGVDRGASVRVSEYAGHLGGVEEFTAKFQPLVAKYASLGECLVFVVDGALWIRNWIRSEYPLATQILDFFHAAEHAGEFARAAIDDATERARWLAEQKGLLLAGSVARVITNIRRRASAGSSSVAAAADTLIAYYQSNSDRMRYDEYIKRGLSIGSGAIESAHRTVVQKRMKLSGQRWSDTGAEHMLDLRVCSMSGKWDMLVDIIRKPHSAVA